MICFRRLCTSAKHSNCLMSSSPTPCRIIGARPRGRCFTESRAILSTSPAATMLASAQHALARRATCYYPGQPGVDESGQTQRHAGAPLLHLYALLPVCAMLMRAISILPCPPRLIRPARANARGARRIRHWGSWGYLIFRHKLHCLMMVDFAI